MIMAPGRPLLLPATPGFVWGSLGVALLLNLLPFGRTPWMPDLLALVLVFWSVHQPLRVGIGTAFVLGLVMDVHQTTLLGQHAWAYTALSYGAISVQRRLLWFSEAAQTLQVAPLLFAAHLIEMVIRLVGGGVFPGWLVLLAPLIEAMLWPVVSVLLLAPQRRPPDPDKHRPL